MPTFSQPSPNPIPLQWSSCSRSRGWRRGISLLLHPGHPSKHHQFRHYHLMFHTTEENPFLLAGHPSKQHQFRHYHDTLPKACDEVIITRLLQCSIPKKICPLRFHLHWATSLSEVSLLRQVGISVYPITAHPNGTTNRGVLQIIKPDLSHTRLVVVRKGFTSSSSRTDP